MGTSQTAPGCADADSADEDDEDDDGNGDDGDVLLRFPTHPDQ